jgi:magnesium-transporting ATPase (P-type)
MQNSHNEQPADEIVVETNAQPIGQQPWHVLSFEAVRDNLQTDLTRGLTQSEAARRLAHYDPNTLARRTNVQRS